MWISNYCYFRGGCLKRLSALHLVKKGFEMAAQKCFGFPSRRISFERIKRYSSTDFALSISRILFRMRLNVIGDFKPVFLNFFFQRQLCFNCSGGMLFESLMLDILSIGRLKTR